MFVQTKQRMNPNHEFGIAVLTEGAFWVNYSFIASFWGF